MIPAGRRDGRVVEAGHPGELSRGLALRPLHLSRQCLHLGNLDGMSLGLVGEQGLRLSLLSQECLLRLLVRLGWG